MAIKSFLKAAKEIQENQRKQTRKKNPESDDESGWLTSYADLMTLLCAFFIMMFSMATLNAEKIEKVKENVSETFKGEYEAPNEDLAKFVEEVVREAGVEDQVKVKADPNGVSVAFESTVFFDSLSAFIRLPGRAALGKIIDQIQVKQDSIQSKFRIVVEGHTDSRPVLSGQYPSNWELSAARAARVARMFISKGFDRQRVIPVGYSDTRPEYPNRKPSGEWDHVNLSKNRRVVVRILNSSVDPFDFKPEPAKSTKAPQSAIKADPAKNTSSITAH